MTLVEPSLHSSKLKKHRSHQIDIDSFIKRQKSYPTSKKDILGQAIGRKTKTVFDATGGWAGDALHLCSQGFDVKIAERNSILKGFLCEALSRLTHSSWARNNNIIIPQLMALDAIVAMCEKNFANSMDCIYLDPMFPEKRKRSALAKKNMQILHQLVGEDKDQELLFSTAYKAAKHRVVTKRPGYAQSLGLSSDIYPSQTLQGKLVHYDIYLKH